MNVLTTQCKTCIFRPGNLMQLRKGRVQQMVRDCIRDDSYIPCHETLTYEDEEAATAESPVCRGFYDKYPGVGQIIRISERIGMLEFVNAEEVAHE